jgi:hypothetical protein
VPGSPDARNRKKCCDDNSRHVDPRHLKNALQGSAFCAKLQRKVCGIW